MNRGPYRQDTIAARATAQGLGGIGIIRISGAAVRSIAEAILGSVPKPRYAVFHAFKTQEGEAIDQGLALFFPGPDSFTGEDVLELQGHGGPVVLDMLLNRVVSLGARIAEPGEFSKRAFLNDKIDLAQAEAIADLIESRTSQAARGAMRSLTGDFSRRINGLLADVIELRVYVEAAIDFPEEEIDFLSDDKVKGKLGTIHGRLSSILARASTGALLNEGASVAIIGRPNAGKSSLMNLLTGKDTSIVTDIPGTTRDVVHESLQINGIPLNVVDTAGIRETDDVVEQEGVKRARAATGQADLVIVIADGSDPNWTDDMDELVLEAGEQVIRVCNKIDLMQDQPGRGVVALSAKTGAGLPDLEAAIQQHLGVEVYGESDFTARRRHVTALEKALEALDEGLVQLNEHQAGELLAEDLKRCQSFIGEITGEFTADDLLGEIFSSFCIGK